MPQSNMENYAFNLIEKILNQVTYDESQPIHKSEKFLLDQHAKDVEVINTNINFVENEDNYEVKNIKWPQIGEFTVELGEKKVDEFMKTTWEYSDCWLYCIDFIEKIEKEFTTLYNYRACWSIPTRRKPIPRFTASVYFTIDVSKIKPKESEVNVFYVFETQKLVHKPGVSRFRQQWLTEIIDLKEALINGCKF
ncbi:unnamed protein product [Brachionus calyciflorus]|uniref:A-kinase anchor protein 14 n=1 Tax=Brachionus calyciflorus TaxID=104777 RepID=A0A813X813_9BILA|nr:unnamed protein product [Brachionus calyciflorus]